MFNKKYIEHIERENKELKERLRVAKHWPAELLERSIVWIDKDKMSQPDRERWANDAKALLDNPVFQSLVGKIERNGTKTNGELVKNLIEGIARNSKDFDEVKFLRATINGVELIREYAEDLLITKPIETFNSLNEPI